MIISLELHITREKECFHIDNGASEGVAIAYDQIPLLIHNLEAIHEAWEKDED